MSVQVAAQLSTSKGTNNIFWNFSSLSLQSPSGPWLGPLFRKISKKCILAFEVNSADSLNCSFFGIISHCERVTTHVPKFIFDLHVSLSPKTHQSQTFKYLGITEAQMNNFCHGISSSMV